MTDIFSRTPFPSLPANIIFSTSLKLIRCTSVLISLTYTLITFPTVFSNLKNLKQYHIPMRESREIITYQLHNYIRTDNYVFTSAACILKVWACMEEFGW